MIAPPIDDRTRRVPQLHALTGLRGLAAWWVVLYHIRFSLAQLAPPDVVALLGKGYLAVDLFFMLSGFVLWLNYGAHLREAGLAGAPHFWWRRFARIWPLHAALLFALLGFVALLMLTGRDTAGYPLAEWPLHLLLVQNWGFTPDLSWNHPAWSISAELAAYLLFPLLVLALRWDRLRAPALLVLLGALALALHMLFAVAGAESLGHGIAQFGLWRCLAEFAMGMALANLWLLWRDRKGAAPLLGLAGAAIMGIGLFAALPETAFVPLGFALFLLALALDSGPVSRLLQWRPLRLLGDWSYATYLAHFPLFIAFKLGFVGDDLQLSWATLALFLALTLGLSAALYRLLERPAQRWLNARAPRRAARRRVAAPS